MSVWKRGGLQLALSMQIGALEYATFFWAGASALLWIVCNSVHASSLRSLGSAEPFFACKNTSKWGKITPCCLSNGGGVLPVGMKLCAETHIGK